ncbi:MAG: glycine/sarcosine/betaine reductase selenoprotein B family protein [Gaiellaceae bacterium]
MSAGARQEPVPYIERTRTKYDALGYEEYRWLESDPPPPWTPLRKPIAESRLGLISTGGVYARGQTAFTYKDDVSYRAIPTDVSTDELRATHFAYDLTDARTDINCVFPIDTLRCLVDQAKVGQLAPNFYTCMGGIYSRRRVREDLVSPLVERCVADNVDVVLLVPV